MTFLRKIKCLIKLKYLINLRINVYRHTYCINTKQMVSKAYKFTKLNIKYFYKFSEVTLANNFGKIFFNSSGFGII